MPNPVMSFEIRGRDPARLRAFYEAVFGWQVELLPGGYAIVATAVHEHGPADETIYTGEDAHMNDGVLLGSAWGQPGWKFAGERDWRFFEPGIGGGIGEGAPGVTIYVNVPDLGAALQQAASNGGSIVLGPTEVAPGVTIASFADPEGNRISLMLAPVASGGA